MRKKSIRLLFVAYAAINLAVGVALAVTQPGRAVDLLLVREWCRAFLFEGRQLYAGPGASVDYPPNAIVVFAPLAIVPSTWLVLLWTGFNLLLTPLVAYLVVRCTTPRARLTTIVTMALLFFSFFSWGGVRTLLELSRVCLALAFAGVLVADSKPIASGFFLGLALAKPHIAGPIWLWTAVTGRARTAAVALLVAAGGLGVYCLRVHANPVEVVVEWTRIVRTLYSGPDTMVGRTSLRIWWQALAPDVASADWLWLLGASALLLVPCLFAVRNRSNSREAPQAALALFCLWSLLTVFHLGNNLILMLPAFTLLLLADDPETRRLRLTVAGVVQFAMMSDVPVHLRRFDSGHGLWSVLIRDFDRIAIVLAFCCVVVVWRRRRSYRTIPFAPNDPSFGSNELVRAERSPFGSNDPQMLYRSERSDT